MNSSCSASHHSPDSNPFQQQLAQLSNQLQQSQSYIEQLEQDRKQLQAQVDIGSLDQEQQVAFRSFLFQQLPIGWLLCKMDGTIIDTNLACAAILGRSVAELLTLTEQEITPEHYAASEQSMLALLEIEQHPPYEKEYIHKDGHFVPVRLSRLVVEHKGELFLWSSVEDISERKQAEHNLQKSEEKLKLFVQHSPYSLAMFDQNMHYLVATQRWIKDYDLPSDVVHRSHYELFPNLPDHWREAHQHCLAGETASGEEAYQRADGVVKWVKWEAQPWYDSNGEIGGIIMSADDLSERKQAELALRQSEARLQAILDNSPAAIYVKDLAGRFIFSNRALQTLLGYDRQQLLSKTDYDTAPPEFAERFVAQDRAVVEARVAQIWEDQFPTVTGTIYYHTVKFPLFDEQGNPYAVCGMSTDISDRKQAANELHRRTQELEQALLELQRTQSQLVQSEKMSSLGQLVAGVAHEINNPVNFIYGNLSYTSTYTQNLLKLVKLYQRHHSNLVPEIVAEIEEIDLEFLMEDLPKLLNSMRVGAERIQKIVASLRTFSRMDEAEIKAVNIHEGIDSTLMILQSRLKKGSDYPGVEVIKNYGDLPLVQCYAGQLNQVFMNILSNAIDALKEAWETGTLSNRQNSVLPCIWIHTHLLDDRQIQIRIVDNGRGIPKELQQRIFEPFYTTKAVGKGTGLGLSISYQVIVERHRGTLLCRSAPGEGTEFSITIPIHS